MPYCCRIGHICRSHIDDRLPRELEAKLSMGKKTTTNYMRQNLLTLRQDSKDVKAAKRK